MIVEVQAIDKAARDPDMPEFEAIARDMHFAEGVARELQDLGVGCQGIAAEEFDAQLCLLMAALVLAKDGSCIVQADRQGLLLIMIEVETTDGSGIFWP